MKIPSQSKSMARIKIFILFVQLIFCAMILAQQREILIDDEGPNLKVNKNDVFGNEDNIGAVEHAPCHLEFQVMKRVLGTCIKLGRTARGCVAGNYLHPLHPACM